MNPEGWIASSMRPSKSRSRPKNNRRPTGNIINRVFDSSGPEGKVRGTPQQIIDKYLGLARDATLSNDRVAAENFHQHAEHYTRMLGEAMREAEARRDQHESQFRRERGPNEGPESGEDDRRERGNDPGQDAGQRGGEAEGNRTRHQEGGADASPDRGSAGSGAEVIESGSDSGLVDTPESQPKSRRGGGGRRRAPGTRASGGSEGQAGDADSGASAGDPPPASAAE